MIFVLSGISAKIKNMAFPSGRAFATRFPHIEQVLITT